MALLPRWNLPALPSKSKTYNPKNSRHPRGVGGGRPRHLAPVGLGLSKQKTRREDKSPVNLLGVHPQIRGAEGNNQEGLEVMLPERELWAGWHQGSCWDKSRERNVNTEECNLWREDKGVGKEGLRYRSRRAGRARKYRWMIKEVAELTLYEPR